MKNNMFKLASALAALSLGAAANAVELDLSEWGFNVDGTTYCTSGSGCDFDGTGSLPGSIDASGYDFSSTGPTAGLGSITATISGTGAHSFDFYVDLDIDAATNTFLNESGSATGAPEAGQSWEIDEPGFNPPVGDIFPNFQNSALDNGIFTGAIGGLPPICCDIAMAMGWDFILGVDEVATIELLASDMMPNSGFYLTQTDPDSVYNVYLSGNLTIDAGQPPGVPEPGSLLLVGVGLVGLAATRRRRRR